MSDVSLFDPDDLPPAPAPAEKLSADRRRTLNQKRLLSEGTHPATKLPLAGNGETCGSCAHHDIHERWPRRWHKCEYTATSGAGSDIRVSWPACVRWHPEEET